MTEQSDSQATPEEQPTVGHSKEPTVNLADEAARAASNHAPPKEKIRSLDDLDVDGEIRSQIESYVSKAINEAVSRHDERQQKKLSDDGYMNRSQIEQLLAEKDAAYRRSEEAKERFLSVLGSEGLHPGSEGYKKVQDTYFNHVRDGKITQEILLTEAGIRTLVAMSGVSGSSSAGPRSGLTRSAPTPDGSTAWADGSVQLNTANNSRRETLLDRTRRAVERSVDSTR